MKKIQLGFLLTVFILIQACGNNENRAGRADTTDTSSVATTEVEEESAGSADDPADTTSNDVNKFLVEAASGGMMEVQLGELARNNAQNPRVKSFAAMMVADHSKANNELKQLAGQKNLTLPASLSPEHQEHVSKLSNKKGAEFDREYMNLMVKDHKEDVDKFEEASRDLKDAQVKAFASKTLAVLKIHADSAKTIHDSVKD
jgi:putative membrane protein